MIHCDRQNGSVSRTEVEDPASEPGPPCDVCGAVVLVLDITADGVRQECVNGHRYGRRAGGTSFGALTFRDADEVGEDDT